MKFEVSSLYLTFCHEFFMESLRVFSYGLENSCCWQKTIQNTPIHCACNAVHENSEFSKILGFIAWRFHIEIFLNYEVKILESCTYFGVGPKYRFWDLQSPCKLVGTVLGAPLACLWTPGRLRRPRWPIAWPLRRLPSSSQPSTATSGWQEDIYFSV